METKKTIPATEFHSRFKATGVGKSAIFEERKALMEQIYATGYPIYCDQSYYAQYEEYHLVEKVGDTFVCERYKGFEDWRECHYYYAYADAEGNIAWKMTGGRYD